MQTREALFDALSEVLVSTAKQFLLRRHPELWDRDNATLKALPTRRRWIDLVKTLDEILWQLPTYDQAQLQKWESTLRSRGLPSLINLSIRWTKDFQRHLKEGKLQNEYDRLQIRAMLSEFSGISVVERSFWEEMASEIDNDSK